jgi:hypothetical protein
MAGPVETLGSPWPPLAIRPRRNTSKPRYNESEGTNDFMLYGGGLSLQGLFTLTLTTKGIRTNSLLPEFRYSGIVIAWFQCNLDFLS